MPVSHIVSAAACILLAWLIALTVTLVRFLASSVASLRSLLILSIRVSSPAALFPAAFVLLSTREPTLVIPGIIAIYFATPAILLNQAPDSWNQDRKRWKRKRKRGPAYRWNPAFLSTIAFEAGVCALFFSPFAAGLCFVCSACFLGACIWNARGPAATPVSARQMLGYVSLSMYIMLFLVSEIVPLPNPDDAAGDLAAILSYAVNPDRQTRTAAANPRPPVHAVSLPRPKSKSGGAYAPGIILKYKAGDHSVMYDPRPGPAIPGGGSLVPFTGEYHIHVAGSRTFPRNAIVEFGSALDVTYENIYHLPVVTEVEQPLRPAVDLALCSRLRALVQHSPTDLMLAEFRVIHDNHAVDIGSDLLGGDDQVRDTVDLSLSNLHSPFLITGIVATFTNCGPRDRHKSAKAAVLGWYFIAK